MEIKVLGTGCAKCQKLYQETAKVLEQLGIVATLTKVEKIDEILRFNVLMTPALVIDGEVKAAGRIPNPAELTHLITTAAAKG